MKACISLCKTLLACALVFASNAATQKSFEQTRLSLERDGFKTALTNFNFSTSPELREREKTLLAIPVRPGERFLDHPDLLEAATANEAIVVWKQDSLRRRNAAWPSGSRELTWSDFADAIGEYEEELDAATAALQSGAIQFNLDASHGNHMLLRHLPQLKNLTELLNDRVILALHEGDRQTAWTNLLAATRLVTAWNVEPLEVSLRVRLSNAKLVFKATWQALQTNAWTDAHLARLQAEWENADLLRGLPEVHAFRRAADLHALLSDPQFSANSSFEVAERLLHFYRDRESEYRNAIQAKSWQQMRSMPGVTNEIDFDPGKAQGAFAMALNQRRIVAGFGAQGGAILEQAAEAETHRRVLIAALALHRHHAKNNRFPDTLQTIAPEFAKSVANDFINGQPLHYRLTDNGRFLLYSVGLDGNDDAGQIGAEPSPQQRLDRLKNPTMPMPKSDIVWPLEASPAQIAAWRERQSQTEAQLIAKRNFEAREEARRAQESAEAARKIAMQKLAAAKPALAVEPTHQGKPLSFWVDKIGRDDGPPQDAVDAIRAIGAKAVPFLLEWMPHPDSKRPVEGYPEPSDIETAWWALGPAGDSAIPELARRLSVPPKRINDHAPWAASARAISHLGPKAVAPMLTVATDMRGQRELPELLGNFQNLGTNGAPAVPTLVQFANDPDYFVRAALINALGGIAQHPDISVPILLNALRNDPEPMVRRDAAEALGAFAIGSQPLLDELAKTLKDPDWQARGGALSGLGKIKTKPQIVVPLIAPFLYDTNNVLQRSAAYALRDLENDLATGELLKATNASHGFPGINDIIHEAREKSASKSP